MARLVSTQTGVRRSRIRVIGRHVTVRHELSDAFLKGRKNRRKPSVLTDSEALVREQAYAPAPDRSRGVFELPERPAAPIRRQETSQLPRLGAYLDKVTGPVPSDDPVSTEVELPQPEISRVLNRKDRVQKSTRRSAYEELCAKWGRI